MNEKLDLRGLLCPEPVIATRKALLDKAGTEPLEVLVDDEICVANLQRLCGSLKTSCQVRADAGYFVVTISRQTAQTAPGVEYPAQAETVSPERKNTGSIVFITREQFGEGDPDFSKTLANVFLQTLFEAGHRPRAILMANSGVKLMSAGSPTRKVLDDFRQAGCDVFCCGLCLEYYGLSNQIAKEQIINMFAICEYITAAEKVIQF